MTRIASTPLGAALWLCMLAGAACSTVERTSEAAAEAVEETAPVVEIPQIERLPDAADQLAGDQSRAYQACEPTAEDAEELIACMKRYGYAFIEQGPNRIERECWDARTRPDALPRLVCFTEP